MCCLSPCRVRHSPYGVSIIVRRGLGTTKLQVTTMINNSNSQNTFVPILRYYLCLSYIVVSLVVQGLPIYTLVICWTYLAYRDTVDQYSPVTPLHCSRQHRSKIILIFKGFPCVIPACSTTPFYWPRSSCLMVLPLNSLNKLRKMASGSFSESATFIRFAIKYGFIRELATSLFLLPRASHTSCYVRLSASIVNA